MPADFYHFRYRLPKFSHTAYGVLMHSLETALGFGASEQAQFRLHALDVLEKHGWQAFHDAFPQVSRATIFRWRQRFLASGKRLASLVPTSTRPHRTRHLVVPSSILTFLQAMRQQHPHLSKYKLKPFLDAWCANQSMPYHSVSWIGKVIARHQLFFGTRHRVVKRRRHARSGYTIRRTPSPEHLSVGYLQLDGVTVYWAGKKLVFLTAIEVKTRMAWAQLVTTLSSVTATRFLNHILTDCSYPIHTIHTDNGSEFHAVFDDAVEALHMVHLWSPPRAPKIHSHIERFNGTFQQEFVDYAVDVAVVDRLRFQDELTRWLQWYNTQRPHHALHLMSPQQYLVHLQKGAESLKCP